MQHFIEEFLIHHVAQLTVHKEMTGTIRKYFTPLHHFTLEEIKPLVIERWFHGIGQHSHAMANKSLSILRTMFEKAKDWELYHGDNPARRVKKYPKKERERFVTPDEMPALQAALQREDETIQCYFLLCLLVGCRRGEALTLKWEHLDVQRSVWTKPETKTGRSHVVPVPAILMHRIQALPRRNEWVFATKHGHMSISLIYEYWVRIRDAACVDDLTIHDLRRTCASWLSMHGENMAIIAKGVLNHTTLSNTGVYARLQVSPVARALEDNSRRILGSHLKAV